MANKIDEPIATNLAHRDFDIMNPPHEVLSVGWNGEIPKVKPLSADELVKVLRVRVQDCCDILHNLVNHHPMGWSLLERDIQRTLIGMLSKFTEIRNDL